MKSQASNKAKLASRTEIKVAFLIKNHTSLGTVNFFYGHEAGSLHMIVHTFSEEGFQEAGRHHEN